MCMAKPNRVLVCSLACYDVDDSHSYLLREDPLNLSPTLTLNLGVYFSTPVAFFKKILFPPTMFRFPRSTYIQGLKPQ